MSGIALGYRSGREPPPVTGEPAGCIRLFGRTAQRLDGGQGSLLQGLLEAGLRRGIATADARDDPDVMDEPGRIALRTPGLPSDQQETSVHLRIGQRDQ